MKIIRSIIAVCLLSIISIATFSSCEKIASDTPNAIKKIIREKSKWEKEGARIFEYEYNNEFIYCCWKPCSSHAEAFFYDEKGNLLWEIDRGGGVIGTPLEGFYENAVYKRIVWTHRSAKNCSENIRPAQMK